MLKNDRFLQYYNGYNANVNDENIAYYIHV